MDILDFGFWILDSGFWIFWIFSGYFLFYSVYIYIYIYIFILYIYNFWIFSGFRFWIFLDFQILDSGFSGYSGFIQGRKIRKGRERLVAMLWPFSIFLLKLEYGLPVLFVVRTANYSLVGLLSFSLFISG